MPQVLNKYHGNIPTDAVWIMRGKGAWGNPFEIGKDGDREAVIAKYEKWLLAQPQLIAKAQKELRGKDLVCCCTPKHCHGHILIKIANTDLTPTPLTAQPSLVREQHAPVPGKIDQSATQVHPLKNRFGILR